MQLSQHILAAIAAVSLAVVGNAAPGPGEVGEYWDISCKYGEPNNIVSSDIKNMASHLASQTTYGGLQSPYKISQNNDFTLYYGTAAINVVNKYLIDTATVEFRHISGALDAMRNQCCGNYPTCIGSTALMRSSNYKNLLLILRKN